MQSQFQIPFNENTPFYLHAKADNWNYATLFTLIGGGRFLSDYQASLTGNLDLQSETGGMFKATGKGQISKVTLQRGSLMLQNQGPMETLFRNGQMTLKNFKLTNPQDAGNSLIEFKGENFSREDFAVSVQINTPLRLFQIFLPFLDELNGQVKTSVQMGGPLLSPEVLGSGSIEDGFFRLKGFPHAFEKLNAQAQFSQKKISIQSVSGTLAGGVLSGGGEIQIVGLRQFPVNIRGQLENASFNVPEGFHTQGSADVALSGQWFPFTLSGTYRVMGGLIDKEFGDANSQQSLRASSYLPKFILQDAFEPILLDLQVVMDRPLAIKNSLIEGQLAGQLQITGPPTSPSISGRVATLRGSKLLFSDKSFEVISGQVTFANPDEINPDLYFSARSRVTDYDVNLLVQGNAKAPLVRLNSVPPLPEPDIVSLLALGVISQRSASTTNRSSNTANSSSSQEDAQMQAAQLQIGTALLSNTVAKPLQNTLGLNLQISSQYDDTKNVTVQKVTISRDLGKRLNASASRLRGEQASTEFRLKYLINQSLSAVASFENREAADSTVKSTNAQKQSESILGLDLEFRQEFK